MTLNQRQILTEKGLALKSRTQELLISPRFEDITNYVQNIRRRRNCFHWLVKIIKSWVWSSICVQFI